MIAYLIARRRELLGGVLFRPILVVAAFGALGLGLPAVDGAALVSAPFLFSGDAPAARTVLSTIASSLVTVAALSFSLMIVTLQLVSSQFTPRAISGILADGMHQLTIGAFVGIFMYCLLVLRLVRDDGFVPALSVTAAVVFAVAGLLLLVLFIHNLSQSIKVSRIAARISRATTDAIDRLYPRPYKGGELTGARAVDEDADAVLVQATEPGYIQTIHVDSIADAARAKVHVRVRPGDFVTMGSVLVSIASGEAGEVERAVRQAVNIAQERDIEQDALYGMRQLSDIALRALSPALNDPTTAVLCVHHLGVCLDELVVRQLSSPQVLECASGAELILERVTFDEHLEVFYELTTVARDHPRVGRELIAVLSRASRAARDIGALDRERTLEAVAREAAPAVSA